MEIDINTGIIIISMFTNSGILLAYFGSIEKRLCRIEWAKINLHSENNLGRIRIKNRFRTKNIR